jgi:hypothetical protein
MLGNYRVATQLVASRVVLSFIQLVNFVFSESRGITAHLRWTTLMMISNK